MDRPHQSFKAPPTVITEGPKIQAPKVYTGENTDNISKHIVTSRHTCMCRYMQVRIQDLKKGVLIK